MKPARDLSHTEPVNGVHLGNPVNHPGLRVDHSIRSQRFVGLADIPVPVRRTAQHADFTGSSAISFAAPRAFQDLRSFVLGDHALELYEQLIFCGGALGCLHEARLHAVSSQLLDQQDLIGVFATQPIGRVGKDDLHLAFCGKVSYAFKARPLERRAADPRTLERRSPPASWTPSLTRVPTRRCCVGTKSSYTCASFDPRRRSNV